MLKSSRLLRSMYAANADTGRRRALIGPLTLRPRLSGADPGESRLEAAKSWISGPGPAMKHKARHILPSQADPAAQCDISTGSVMNRSRSRVTPPSTISRVRECP